MGKIYIVRTEYAPNKAETNRALAFLHGFSDLGVEVEMVFLIPDSKKSILSEDFPKVKVTYLWRCLPITDRYLRQLLFEMNSFRFVRSLNSGDVVILLDRSRLLFPLLKARKKGVRVFLEQTEHPEAYHLRTINMNLYKRVVRDVDGLFVISTSLKDYFTSALGVDGSKISIVNMTVDPSRFDGVAKHASERYIAYCGTASNNKDGVDELIRAFALVHDKYPDVRLYIIGETPDKGDVAGNLRLISNLHLKNHVIFTGVVPAIKMPQLLKDAEVLALDRPDSLQARHGFPTKLGEYLLTENPVVVTGVGDIPLFIRDGYNGLLAKERNPEDFSEKLIWALEHPVEAKEIGKRGAELAMREFNYLTETRKILSSVVCKNSDI